MVNWEGSERKWSLPVLRYYSKTSLKDVRKMTEHLDTNNLLSGLRVEPGTSWMKGVNYDASCVLC